MACAVTVAMPQRQARKYEEFSVDGWILQGQVRILPTA